MSTPRSVDGTIISEISKGLMVLVGIGTGQRPTCFSVFGQQHFLTRVDSVDDTPSDIEVLTNKMYINTPFDAISTSLYSRRYL